MNPYADWIQGLPQVDTPFEGLDGRMIAGPHGQTVFFRAEEPFEVPPHSHGAQRGGGAPRPLTPPARAPDPPPPRPAGLFPRRRAFRGAPALPRRPVGRGRLRNPPPDRRRPDEHLRARRDLRHTRRLRARGPPGGRNLRHRRLPGPRPLPRQANATPTHAAAATAPRAGPGRAARREAGTCVIDVFQDPDRYRAK